MKHGRHNSIRDPFVKRFRAYDKLQEYAERVEDIEIMGKCRIISDFPETVDENVANIRLYLSGYTTRFNENASLLTEVFIISPKRIDTLRMALTRANFKE